MLRKPKALTNSMRNRVDNVVDLADNQPIKSLVTKGASRRNGRNNQGKITVRHRGGGARRKTRILDWKRNKFGVPGTVIQMEYDPNRNAHILLVHYVDGDKRYMVAPRDLAIGAQVMSGPDADLKVGNALPMSQIPLGMPIHNIEMRPGKGAQLVRGAGVAATIQAKDENYATILLPSKEVRLIDVKCMATIGEVGNADAKNARLGKAGRMRHLGIRPRVRGTAMHPGAHPHGGGEGRSGIGLKHPKTPWGKPARGKKTRTRRKYSSKFIVRDRRSKA